MVKHLIAAVAALVLCASGTACAGDEGGAATTSTSTISNVESSADVRSGEPRSVPEDLTVLITNDDGVAAPGIDALVEALSVRDGIEVVVVAPASNQSGSGGRITEGELVATETTTASGHPATAVEGYPADSVRWALTEGGVKPDLVVSGINEGQNIGPLVPLSGTVGAARQAAQMGVPAIAVSQGIGDPPDYPTGVRSLLDWLDDNSAALASGDLGTEQITSINVPTCPDSAVQGSLEVPLAEVSSVDLFGVDCDGAARPVDDVTAFVNGWVAVTPLAGTGSITE